MNNLWQAPKKQDEVFTMPTEKQKPVDILKKQRQDEEGWHDGGEVIEAQTDNPLAKFDVRQAAINQVKTFSSIVVDVENPETVKDAIAKKKITRDLRLKVQRREKEIDAGYVAQRKALKADANAIYTEIKPVEEHLVAEIKKDTDHKAKLAEAARIEELARVAKIDANIRILTGHCEAALVDGMGSEIIKTHLKNLMDTEIPKGIFQEKYQSACDLLSHAIESCRKNLKARVLFEEAEKKRAAELEELKKQGEINDQWAWFNLNFGRGSSFDTMEKSLEALEKSTFADHLTDTIKQQKIQAQEIIVAARAAKADSDRLEAEKEYSLAWDEAHYINDTFSEVVDGVADPEGEKEIEIEARVQNSMAANSWPVTEPEPIKEQTFASGGVVSGPKTAHVSGLVSNCMFPPMDTPAKEAPTQAKESCLDKTKSILNGKLNTLRDIRESARIGDLKLILSTPDVSGVIMAESDGLQDILRAIEKTLENQVKK
jgi:hypothetical protein